MLKKTIKYEDFDGNEYEEDFYFNLTQAELLDWELSEDGGLDALTQRIIKAKNVPKIVEMFKTLIDKAYGVKSADGKRFMKTKEALDDFKATNAYSWLFMKLASDDKFAVEFIKGIVPSEIRAKMNEDSNVSKLPTPNS